jgi:acetyl-CoA C-acetyltransferase
MESIRDRVAVIGVGYTKFGEQWDKSAEDLVVEAGFEAYADAGIEPEEIDGAWVGIQYPFTGLAGVTLADPLKLYGIPITHVENFCASGMDAFRNACLAVASGVHDVVLAAGVEKITDQGSRGLPTTGGGATSLTKTWPSTPGMFGLVANRAFRSWGWSKESMANVAVKNHAHGAHHPKAHFRKPITLEEAMKAPIISSPLGRYDCCAISDGAAALIITTPERARQYRHRDDFVKVKANAIAVFTGEPWHEPGYDFLHFPSTETASRRAYTQAGIQDPARELDFVECHDCFTITELINCQDLGLCKRGEAADFVKDGNTRHGGMIPVNVSGGLKCFGHPIGATGCRMLVELTKQLQGRADGLQVQDAKLGLAHNLGGPYSVCSVTILGRNDT